MARTRAALLTAAEEVFQRDGFARATVETIAETADVSVGSLYHHFGSKDGILLALIEQAIDANARYLDDAFELPVTPVERMVALQEAYVRFFLEQPFSCDLIILEYERLPVGYTPEAVDRIAERAQCVLDRIAALVAEAQAAGEVRDVDPRDAARFMWSAINGLLASTRRPDHLRLSDEELLRILITGQDLVLYGLATAKGLRRLRGTTSRTSA